MLLLLISSLLVTDPGGEPVPGAWIRWDGLWRGLADSLGVYTLTGEEPDLITIHATGFRDWTGSPRAGTAVLQPAPVSSGGVILVSAGRSSFRKAVPSLVMLGARELGTLSRTGFRGLTLWSPGISAREYGGAMPVVSLSSRGADPGQTRWMVDGRPVDTGRDGLPAGLADPWVFGALEVARGGSGAVGGGAAGLFNFRTEAPGSPWRAMTEVDHRGGARMGYSGDTPLGRLGLVVKRTTGAEDSRACSVTGVMSGPGWGVMAAGAAGEVESPDWTVPTDGARSQGQLETWGTAGPVLLRGGIGGMAFESTLPDSMDDRHTDFGADGETGFSLGVLSVRTGAGWRGLASSAAGNRHRFSPWTAVGWERTGALRASIWLRGGFAGETPWWCARGAVQGNGILSPWAALSRDVSVPTFNDLYWPSDPFARGNPDLEPQTSLGAEGGVRFTPGESLFLGAAGFLTRTEDLILWLPGDDGVWTPENNAESFSRGVELEAGLALESLRVTGNLTLSTVTDESPGTPREGMLLPYRPQVTGGGSLTLTPAQGWDAALELSGQGTRFTNRTETLSLPPYLLLDFSAGFPAVRGLRLRAWVLNAAGVSYRESGGYRGRPRTFGLTIETGESP